MAETIGEQKKTKHSVTELLKYNKKILKYCLNIFIEIVEVKSNVYLMVTMDKRGKTKHNKSTHSLGLHSLTKWWTWKVITEFLLLR